MTIKERIQALLKEKNISAVHLEQDLGFAKGYISKLDKASPSADNIVKIANYLNVPTDVLLKDTETVSLGIDLGNSYSIFDRQDIVSISPEARDFAIRYDKLPPELRQTIQNLIRYSELHP